MTSPTSKPSSVGHTFLWRRLGSDRWHPVTVLAPSMKCALRHLSVKLKRHDATLRWLVVDHSVKLTDSGGEVRRDSVRHLETPFPIEYGNKVYMHTPLDHEPAMASTR